MGVRPGQVIGGYRLEAFLGQGAMGEVFRARQLETDAVVAIKTFAVTDDDPELALRFQREGEAMARVGRHPNVLAVHALIEHEGHPFLVLEYAGGGDLMGRLRDTQPGDAQLREWLLGLASGVAHLHAGGVVHRDIKPQNVLFDASGTPKLGDFGLARLADAQSLTQSGHMLGTPAYMPPEQIHRAKHVGPPADVYALGALLYRCLTRRPPFKGDSLAATLSLIVHRPPADPRELAPDAPADLAQLCLRMLAKQPADRPTADDVVEALTPAEVAAPAPGGGLIYGLALLAAISLGLCAAVIGSVLAEPPTPPASTPGESAVVIETTPADPPPTTPPAIQLDTAPAPVQIPACFRVRCLDRERAVVLTTERIVLLPLTGGPARELRWRLPAVPPPDGHELEPGETESLFDLLVDGRGGFVVSSGWGRAWRWPDAAADPTPVELPLDRAPKLAFSPSGERLALRTPDALCVVTTEDQRVLWRRPAPRAFRTLFAFVDEATLITAIVEATSSVSTRVSRWSLDDGRLEQETELLGIASVIRTDPRGRVAVGTGAGQILVLDGDGQRQFSPPLQVDETPWVPAAVRDLVFAEDTLVAFAARRLHGRHEDSMSMGKPSLGVWDLESGEQVSFEPRPKKPRYGADWIPGTRFLLTASSDKVYWEPLPGR